MYGRFMNRPYCVAEKISCLHIIHMRRCKTKFQCRVTFRLAGTKIFCEHPLRGLPAYPFSAPCIWANSEFLEAPFITILSSRHNVSAYFLVRMGRLELPRSCEHKHLNIARLPIPPQPQYRRKTISGSPWTSIRPQGQPRARLGEDWWVPEQLFPSSSVAAG